MVVGPWLWSLVRNWGKQQKKKRDHVIVSTQKRNFHNISMYFFYSWCNEAIVFSEVVVSINMTMLFTVLQRSKLQERHINLPVNKL